ncbi:MAG: LUD domain-containing protein [Candidatus ainarchaeum sp.]|nr:LUD domain-containing protein [Candidatus ainarchaeum sp.]
MNLSNEIDLGEKILDSQEKQKNFLSIMYSYKDKRDKLISEEEKVLLKAELKKIKEFSIENIISLKKETLKKLGENGVTIIEVKNEIDAEKELRKIIGNEKLIVKSKSNTANEIKLNEMLKDLDLIETDLGDFLIQLCEQDELHPVLPALHLTPQHIVSVIKNKLGVNIEPDPQKIVEFVRNHLREKIFEAKIGITGANFISADGSIIILENEGNISLVSRIPQKHIIISSFDKIVPTREDALKLVKAASVFGTGQDYPMYVNIISGPSKTADIQNKLITGAQGAKQVFLILLDNGREKILNSQFKELLHCINCGACLNFCPVFHQIFGRYGSKTFLGAKGVLYSFFNESKKDSFHNGAFFCTTCKTCKENCPLDIDLSDLIKKLRIELVKAGIEPKPNKEMIENVRKYGNPFGKIEKGKTPDKMYCC